MEKKQEQFILLLIVAIVGLFGLVAIFSHAIKFMPAETVLEESEAGEDIDLTGAAVRGYAYEKACYASYYDTPNSKGTVRLASVYNNPETGALTKTSGGSTYMDQCYDDLGDVTSYSNNGRYLRQYYCADDFTLAYQWFDCGANRCQFGACIGSYKVVSE